MRESYVMSFLQRGYKLTKDFFNKNKETLSIFCYFYSELFYIESLRGF